MVAEDLDKLIRTIPDFPKPGILFRDITPLLADADGLREAGRLMADPFRDSGVDRVVGIESRGFILGALVARELHCGFVPVRKPGKLPGATISESYALEYGSDTVEMHEDGVRLGHDVLIVDDLIATGGTAAATRRLVERAGASVRGFSFLVELAALRGREKLGPGPATTVLTY